MKNIPEVKLGIIAVSRDCFVISLSEKRRERMVSAFGRAGGSIIEIPTTVENEKDMLKAVDEAKAAGCNALVVLLGNFGPETPETLIAKYFDGPVMYIASAEEHSDDLIHGRAMPIAACSTALHNLGLQAARIHSGISGCYCRRGRRADP